MELNKVVCVCVCVPVIAHHYIKFELCVTDAINFQATFSPYHLTEAYFYG